MADIAVNESEVRRTLDYLSPHKGAGPDERFLNVLKALNPHIAPVLARVFKLSIKTARAPEDCRRYIAPMVLNNDVQRLSVSL